MKLLEIVGALEKIAPPELAEPWDNVGLLAGDPSRHISRIFLTIDCTAEVLEEAIGQKCQLIVAYHPPLLKPINRFSRGNILFDAISSGIAIYSPHTALDVAEGGTNDMLADAIGLRDRRPIRAGIPKASDYKLVVFVPADAIDRVSAAIFDAGAGRIGHYSRCSFQIPGTGTFFGGEQSNPAVGQRGQLETVQEIRLETIVPIEKIEAVLSAMRDAHPYEAPAFDLNVLARPPRPLGQGRIGNLEPISRAELIARVKKNLGIERLLIAGPGDGQVSRAAVCAGSCGEFLSEAMRAGAELFLTGEIRHHDAVAAAPAGMTILCTLHSNSERAVLPRLRDRLRETPGMPDIVISTRDRDPFTII